MGYPMTRLGDQRSTFSLSKVVPFVQWVLLRGEITHIIIAGPLKPVRTCICMYVVCMYVCMYACVYVVYYPLSCLRTCVCVDCAIYNNQVVSQAYAQGTCGPHSLVKFTQTWPALTYTCCILRKHSNTTNKATQQNTQTKT